ncbi:hypothetical protein ACN38_g2379 [Penicillium nordicum]|uniref:Uncharacterized protein n=1 Tax=Penicillium nordicum TaxID=229535 RepID=A0A0M8PEQ7_9EURO|nr:hypothetical protein ACN38_g2379 [Penicillium nordicum]
MSSQKDRESLISPFIPQSVSITPWPLLLEAKTSKFKPLQFFLPYSKLSRMTVEYCYKLGKYPPCDIYLKDDRYI